jgi:hypothetical protein
MKKKYGEKSTEKKLAKKSRDFRTGPLPFTSGQACQKTMLISYVFTFECSTSSIICIWGDMRGMGGMGGMGGRE